MLTLTKLTVEGHFQSMFRKLTIHALILKPLQVHIPLTLSHEVWIKLEVTRTINHNHNLSFCQAKFEPAM